MTRGAGIAELLLGAILLTACAGGAPLLHPAHTLTEGRVTFAAGTSGRLTLGELHRAEGQLNEAAAQPNGPIGANERAGFMKGALSRFAVAPGVAPFVAARVGLGHHSEAGLTYTGRGVRLDGRHAFEGSSLAFSAGVGVSGALARPGERPLEHLRDAGQDSGFRTIPRASVSGYGLELPLLFGYRSDADVVKAWVGLRAGFERDRFDVEPVEAPDTPSSGHATRLWAGGLVGFSVGLDPIEVRVEFDGAYESARGALRWFGEDLEGTVAGWSITPAMAISAKF